MSQQATKKCHFCAEEIKAEAIVCRFCNRDLSDLDLTKRMVIERTSKKFKKYAVIAIILIIIGVILFLNGMSEIFNKDSDAGVTKVFIGFWLFFIGLISGGINRIKMWWDRG